MVMYRQNIKCEMNVSVIDPGSDPASFDEEMRKKRRTSDPLDSFDNEENKARLAEVGELWQRQETQKPHKTNEFFRGHSAGSTDGFTRGFFVGLSFGCAIAIVLYVLVIL